MPFDADLGPWLAVVALAFGIVLLPWGMRRNARTTSADTPDLTPDATPDPDRDPIAFA